MDYTEFDLTSHSGISIPTEDIQILGDIADMDVSKVDSYRRILSTEDEEIARIEYYHFPNSNTAFIGWLKVDSDWQRNGIATYLRQDAINHLLHAIGVDQIWTGPIADEVKPIAFDQGFEPADNRVSKFGDKYYVLDP